MIICVSDIVKCLVEGLCLGKGPRSSCFLHCFFLNPVLLLTVIDVTLSWTDQWFNLVWPYCEVIPYCEQNPLFCGF